MRTSTLVALQLIGFGCSVDEKPDYCETHTDDPRCHAADTGINDSFSADHVSVLDSTIQDDELVLEDEETTVEDGVTDIAFDDGTAIEDNDSDTILVVDTDDVPVDSEEVGEDIPEISVEDVEDTLDSEDSIDQVDTFVPECMENDDCKAVDLCEVAFCNTETGLCIHEPLGPCDDGIPCTDDSCVPTAGCAVIPVSGTSCDDQNPCTDNDICLEGECGGIKNLCDDQKPCTADGCDPFNGDPCFHIPIEGGCNDNSVCTANDQCVEGECKGTNVNPCVCVTDADCEPMDDGDLCNGIWNCNTQNQECYYNPSTIIVCAQDNNTFCAEAQCNQTTGDCEMIPIHEENECTLSKCVQNAQCNNGLCEGTPMVCDDSDPCTQDECSDSVGCVYSGNFSACNDNDPCTINDTCATGICFGDALDCDDSLTCTIDTCLLGTGCTHTASTDACDDSNACTEKDTCATGACKGTAVVCSDNVNCTIDTCDTTTGCIYTTDDLSCTTNLCGQEKCNANTGCTAITVTSCNDDNPCSKDSCDPASGCVYTPQSSVPCNDNSLCTDSDTCVGGFCIGINKCECQKDSDCASKEDGNFCNGTLYCDTASLPYSCELATNTIVSCDQTNIPVCQTFECVPSTGKCAFANKQNGIPCTDNQCLKGTTCGNGVCSSSTSVNCDDNNDCTDDGCDEKTGCTHTMVIPNKGCNDGNNETIADHCVKTVCQGSPIFSENFQDGIAQGWTFINNPENSVSWSIHDDLFNPQAPDPLKLLGLSTVPGMVLTDEVVIRATTPLFMVPGPVAGSKKVPTLWYWRTGGMNCATGSFNVYYNDTLFFSTCGETVSWQVLTIELPPQEKMITVSFEYILHPGVPIPDNSFYRVDLIHSDYF